MLDLILLCVATYFLINKFISILGRSDLNESNKNKKPDEFSWQIFSVKGAKMSDARSAEATIDQDKSYEVVDADIISAHEANLPYSIRNVIREIGKLDSSFSIDQFVHGVNKAFIMIIHSLSKGDEETLKLLLTDKVYKSFIKQIESLKLVGQSAEQRVINVRQITILDATLDVDNQAQIVVSIISEQIHVLRDTMGNILDGNSAKTERITDTWHFSRDYKSEEAVWKLAATR